MSEHDTDEGPNAELGALAKHMGSMPVAPAHGIAAIALQMALKYHDIATVQDGTLYQQYKLEGKNMVSLHLDMILETATKIEMWLLGASERIAKIVVEAVVEAAEHEPTPEASPGAEEGEGR